MSTLAREITKDLEEAHVHAHIEEDSDEHFWIKIDPGAPPEEHDRAIAIVYLRLHRGPTTKH